MQQLTKSFVGQQVDVFEYSLVAHPDVSVSEKVMAQKESFLDDYNQKGVATKPQIVVANFVAREVMEETILRYTQRICSQQQSFEVELNNYSGVPPHTIYLRVQNPQPFKRIVKEFKVIDEYVRSCSCPPVKLISNPYLSVAAGLPESTYLEAMFDYSQKTFHDSFMVTELVLLRRTHPYDTAKTIHVFRLQPASQTFLTNLAFN